MLKLFRRKNHEPEQTEEKPSLFARFKEGLTRTGTQLKSGLSALFLGKKEIDADTLEELESQLLMADLGIEVTQKIISQLTDELSRKILKDPEALMASLKHLLKEILRPCQQPLIIEPSANRPFVLLMVGVNGNGKTTTIGKLANIFQKEGHKVMLAAGDTFRAAAVEQLQVWGERNDVPVIAQQTGSDSASVIYDALQAAKARQIDILIADTAGRLHTKQHLMEELAKIKRVLQKIDPAAPHEIMLVLDAGTGQNALQQAQTFHKFLGIHSLTLTKLDGTAKGGIVFAIANALHLPIRYVGLGEGINDLSPFDADAFVEALFD
jgi:fused signal recognition particle receptor